METTTLKTFEISIPQEYATIMRKFVQSLGGKIHTRKEKKSKQDKAFERGLDEALEDVKAGRVHGPFSSVDEMWKELMK